MCPLDGCGQGAETLRAHTQTSMRFLKKKSATCAFISLFYFGDMCSSEVSGFKITYQGQKTQVRESTFQQ